MLKSAVDYLYKEGASDIYYFCTGKDNYNYRVRKEAFLNTKSNEDTASAKYILDLGDEIPRIMETLLDWLRKIRFRKEFYLKINRFQLVR